MKKIKIYLRQTVNGDGLIVEKLVNAVQFDVGRREGVRVEGRLTYAEAETLVNHAGRKRYEVTVLAPKS